MECYAVTIDGEIVYKSSSEREAAIYADTFNRVIRGGSDVRAEVISGTVSWPTFGRPREQSS
ncbi:MAG: hypothetical protein QGG36_27430 [Pirellulaceae bacterium]|jgi:hypothetical protein|nr:hypothetical protein [Pirellulaceae bacterium]